MDYNTANLRKLFFVSDITIRTKKIANLENIMTKMKALKAQ